MSQTGSTSRTVGSLDSSNDSGSIGKHKDFGNKHRKIIRILTVVAYIMSVSTAALLLSAYYVFLWIPTPSEALVSKRPTDNPLHYANTNYAYGSAYSRHTSSALQAPFPSDPTRSTRTSKKGYNSHANKIPQQMPTPASLIMEKILMARSTTTPQRAPASPPDDPYNPTFHKTTPKVLPDINLTTPKAFLLHTSTTIRSNTSTSLPTVGEGGDRQTNRQEER